MDELGVCQDDFIVCYDQIGIFTSPRVHWNFRYYGAENVKILNGGLKKWLIEGRPVVPGEPNKLADQSKLSSAKFKQVHNADKMIVKDLNHMREISYYTINKVATT